jgi:TolB protein
MDEQAPTDDFTHPPALNNADSEDYVPDEEPKPPPPLPGVGPDRRDGSRWRSIRLAPAGVVLLLALVGIVVYLATSGWFVGTRAVEQGTPTRPRVLTTPTPSTSIATPVAAPSATSLLPQQLDEQLVEAWAFVLQSRFDDAVRLYEALVQQAPDDALPEVGWAWALILDTQSELALEHARHAVELDPLNAESMAVLARAHVEVDDPERAVGLAEAAVQLDDSNALAHAILAEAYLLAGQPQNAVDEAELALARDAAEAEGHRIRGWLYHIVDNDTEQALAELRMAAELQPELWLRHYELGLLLLEAEDYGTATAALKHAMGLRPKTAIYVALGEAFYHLEEYDQARGYLLKALSDGAREADTYALLAATEAQQDRCEDAEAYIELALSQDAEHPLALAAQSTCQGTTELPGPTATRPQPTPVALTGWIAFPVWNGNTTEYDIYVTRPDGRERHLVVQEMHQPAFSPDGSWLAVNGERQNHMNLCIVKPDGTGLREITEHLEDSLPSWSPDGKSLVFSSTRHPDRQSRVYILDNVPIDGDKAQGRALNSTLYELLGEYPTWMDDGRIVYAGCDFTATPSLCGLFLLPSEPGPQTPMQLTSEVTDIAPAAYGRQIAFMSKRDGNWEVYVVNADGSGLKRLTNKPANEGLPAWSPDGKTLAYVSDQGGAWAVWVMSPNGSNQRKLFDIGGGGLPSAWHLERISWGP